LFGKKKKKLKSYNENTPLDQVAPNEELYQDFAYYLTKKTKLSETNLKFFVAIKKFETDPGDIPSRAMNICFEYLGIGGGELTVSVEPNIVSELAQNIRKQASKDMFSKAKLSVETKLRQHFPIFLNSQFKQ